jgi:methylenetetrahydrofolate dehydrogenase (NADP+)/methenyltetrahydrofolate cyclohydrolase
VNDVIDGQAVAQQIKTEVRAATAELAARGVTPCVATVLVGDDYGARMYRRQIERTSAEVGITHRDVTLPADARPGAVLEAMDALAGDPSVYGVLPLRPFPPGIAEGAVLEAVPPDKDIDCLHPINAGRLALGQPRFLPATPWACFELLERYAAGTGMGPRALFEGREVVIVGRSNIVGKPAYFLALARNATPTTVHSFTSRAGRLAAHTRRADILIVAMGRPEFITAEMVKLGAFVVDVGINSVPVLDSHGLAVLDDRGRPKRRTVGDVAFDHVREVAAAITPVPGGVGVVTTALLMKNVVNACGST